MNNQTLGPQGYDDLLLRIKQNEQSVRRRALLMTIIPLLLGAAILTYAGTKAAQAADALALTRTAVARAASARREEALARDSITKLESAIKIKERELQRVDSAFAAFARGALPLVYTHYGDSIPKAFAEELRVRFSENRLPAPGPQRIYKSLLPRVTYYHRSDRETAIRVQNIAKLFLRQHACSDSLPLERSRSPAREGLVEVWLDDCPVEAGDR